MKKYFAIFAAIALLGMAAIYFMPEKTTTATIPSVSSPSTNTTTTAEDDTSSNTTVKPSTTATTSTSAASTYKDGTYTGSTASTPWGDVQIAIVVSGGKIIDVTYNAYPNQDSHSARISSQALPILESETISEQTADIDSVSGASYTSAGYIESLQAAIDAAKV